MNKLLFTLERSFNDDITLISNNHKDLEDYLINNYDWFKIEVCDDYVKVVECEGYETDFGTLKWVTMV